MRARLIQELTFGAAGDDAPHLGEGWSAAEPGYRWSVGPSSELWLDRPGDGDLLLELQLSPFVAPPALEAQRLVVHADGALVGALSLSEGGRRALRIQAGALAGRRDVRLSFMHPDAARPSDHGHPDDTRLLALSFTRLRLYAADDGPSGRVAASSSRIGGVVAQRRALAAPARIDGAGGLRLPDVQARTGLAPAQLATRFESLGDNCEFGLVQRRCGAEPLSLLRFSNIELPQLLLALDAGFDGLGDRAGLELSLGPGPRPELVLFDRSYALTFHTFQHAGEQEEDLLLNQQAQRLAFLRRKLLEDLSVGEKIFVIRRNPPLTEAEALPVWTAIDRHGPGRLLWATLADEDHPPGTVEQAGPGLLRGYLGRLAPDADAHDMEFETWLEVCANALALTAEA